MSLEISGNSNMPPKGVDPNTYAQQYANQKGISLEEAKAELKAKFGDPGQGGPQGANGQQQELTDSLSGANNTQTNSGIPKSELQKLMEAGIPMEVIAQGDNAIKQFADENNITLPEKQTGANLDIGGY